MDLTDTVQQEISAEERELLEHSLNEIEYPKLLEIIAVHAYSERAKEQLLAILPTDDTTWLRHEHNRLNEMVGILLGNDDFPLEHTDDISGLLQRARIVGAYLQGFELRDILDVMSSVRRIAVFCSHNAEEYPSLAERASGIYENKMLEKHINEAIDENGTIRDNATNELQRIRQEIFSTGAKLRSRLNKLVAKLGDEELLQDEYVTQRDGRFVIPMKTERKRAIPGIIHGVSSSGSTVFMEPAEVFEMNNELSLLHNEEQREIVRILSTLTAEIGSVADEIEHSFEVLIHCDMIHAKAKYALANGGLKPRIIEDHEIELNAVYHPILVHSKGKKNVMPLSVSFNSGSTKGINGYLISGPNAGGKSVAMKSIGLNIAMALSGIFPLGDCVTNPRRIFTSIGDHQSIEADLSTFSSQIVRLRQILSYCGQDALVLVDEICSGTDPAEGSALACGILDSFIERGANFIVTTHQSSLKSYALSKESIENASLEFDTTSMKPTYKFLPGVPGNSYAFELATSVGLQEVVLQRAASYRGERHSELEQSIAVMQQYRAEAEQHRNAARQEHHASEQRRREYDQRFNDFKNKYKLLIQAANQEAKEIVDKANAAIQNALRDVREQSRPVADISADISKLKDEIAANVAKFNEEKKAESLPQLSVGDSVALGDNNQGGVILELDAKNALVDFNGMKFKVPVADLKPSSAPQQKKRTATGATILKLDAASTLDVRGMRASETIAKLDIAISDAIIGNVPFLTVIHGKGTGALRQAIHDYLREHPSVAEYKIGAHGEGDAGVTHIRFT
ncbi:MAG: endonuclease MutS2 [Candidatus Kapabacteria bacterium]|nr:endonuclease MutS2 [Candidatus Kapabacteria bacterium]